MYVSLTYSIAGRGSVAFLGNGGGNLASIERSPFQPVEDDEDEDDETKIYEDMDDNDDEHNYE